MYNTAMNIAKLRAARGITQADLEEMTNIPQPSISRIEKGYDGASLRNYKVIASALDVPVYVLFMDDVSEFEVALVKTYRGLSEERKKGWQDMALLAKDPAQQEGE